jgi:hypothetical protein
MVAGGYLLYPIRNPLSSLNWCFKYSRDIIIIILDQCLCLHSYCNVLYFYIYKDKYKIDTLAWGDIYLYPIATDVFFSIVPSHDPRMEKINAEWRRKQMEMEDDMGG